MINRKGYVEEEFKRLTPAQKQRLVNYEKRIGTDRDPKLFDKQLFSVMKELVNDKSRVDALVEYLDGIGFNQSKYEYRQVEEQLKRFTDKNHSKFTWNKNYQKAKQSMIKDWERYGISMLYYYEDEDIQAVLPKRDTSTGFDGVLTGIKSKREFCDAGIQERYQVIENSARERGTFNNIIMMASRTQASGAFDPDNDFKWTGTFKSKSRLVSMVRTNLILAECRFAKPIQNLLGGTNWYAGGKTDYEIGNILTTKRTRFKYNLTIDYSKYDQSISDWLIREAFDIMRCAFDEFRFDEELFAIIREDMINKYFIDAQGNLIESHKGVPSGSMFTQIVDSIVNKLMVTTYLISQGIEGECLIMGDDNIIYSNVEIDKAHLCSYLEKNFGVVANDEKCFAGTSKEDPEFLSRYWRLTGGVWRHPDVLLSKMFYPETFRDYRRGANAKLIIYSYILCFPAGMREIMNVDKFVTREITRGDLLKSSQNVKYLNGLMRLRFEEGLYS